jgi:hypothetical protein
MVLPDTLITFVRLLNNGGTVYPSLSPPSGAACGVDGGVASFNPTSGGKFTAYRGARRPRSTRRRRADRS